MSFVSMVMNVFTTAHHSPPLHEHVNAPRLTLDIHPSSPSRRHKTVAARVCWQRLSRFFLSQVECAARPSTAVRPGHMWNQRNMRRVVPLFQPPCAWQVVPNRPLHALVLLVRRLSSALSQQCPATLIIASALVSPKVYQTLQACSRGRKNRYQKQRQIGRWGLSRPLSSAIISMCPLKQTKEQVPHM
ncbi:hypothetical protein BC835DRAFT_187702 [Cytidiella melzeri]|nr:hypothetical protein BC835DRAFT_187702 [Cytidiella melzeri]